MKLFNCIDRKDAKAWEALFTANGEKGYSALMSAVAKLRDGLTGELLKNGDTKTPSDCDAMLKITAQLSLCEQLLGLNRQVKAAEASKNRDDED